MIQSFFGLFRKPDLDINDANDASQEVYVKNTFLETGPRPVPLDKLYTDPPMYESCRDSGNAGNANTPIGHHAQHHQFEPLRISLPKLDDSVSAPPQCIAEEDSDTEVWTEGCEKDGAMQSSTQHTLQIETDLSTSEAGPGTEKDEVRSDKVGDIATVDLRQHTVNTFVHFQPQLVDLRQLATDPGTYQFTELPQHLCDGVVHSNAPPTPNAMPQKVVLSRDPSDEPGIVNLSRNPSDEAAQPASNKERSGGSPSLDGLLTSAPQEKAKGKAKGKAKSNAKRKPKGNASQEGSEDDENTPVQDWFTTLCVKNLPNNFTRNQLIEVMGNKGCTGYDFVYLPNDLHRLCGLGYAFVNFVSHERAQHAREKLHKFSDWKEVNSNSMSDKICKAGWGTENQQGLDYLIEKYRNSPMLHPDVPEQARPMRFNADGEQIEFPKPTRPVKAPRLKKTRNSDKQGMSLAD